MKLTLLCLAALTATPFVAGHGALTSFQGQSPSSIRDYPSEGQAHNFPVRIGSTCSSKGTPKANVAVSAGSTITYGWTLTAAHVGDCATYISYDNGATYARLTVHKNCRTYSTGSYTIPSNFPNGNALFVWEWIALHQYPNIEYYIQCVDITVTNGVTNGATPQPAIILGSNINSAAFYDPFNGGPPANWQYPGKDATVGGAAVTPTPSSSYKPPGIVTSPSASASPAQSPTNGRPPVPAPVTSTQPTCGTLVTSGQSCSASGKTACAADGPALCANGVFYVFKCPSGLVCNPSNNVCDWSYNVKNVCPTAVIASEPTDATALVYTANFYLGLSVTEFNVNNFAMNAELSLAAVTTPPQNWSLVMTVPSNTVILDVEGVTTFGQSGLNVTIYGSGSLPFQFKIYGTFANGNGQSSDLTFPAGYLYNEDIPESPPQGVLPVLSVIQRTTAAFGDAPARILSSSATLIATVASAVCAVLWN